MSLTTLRPLIEADREATFRLESDPAGSMMIAFLPREPGDREAFEANWRRLTESPEIVVRAIEVDGAYAGYALSFVVGGEREVGYWVDRALWGRGIAAEALALLLTELDERPLWGRAAADNAGSRRVLEKCGFVLDREERAFAPRRGTEIDEVVYRLD